MHNSAICLFWILLLEAFAVEAQPIIVEQPTNQIIIVSNTATFSVFVSGVGPFTYQWLFNETNLATSGIIMTVAGTGAPSFYGDGGAATNAALYLPYGVTVDANGNLFIADEVNNRIRKVDTDGIITTVAGNGYGAGTGNGGYSGDGNAAINAELWYPSSVAVDAGGNLFIADSENNRIRKVDTNGVITTVAGKGPSSFSGDGSKATNATLYWPQGLALDAAGNLFIADSWNNRIRKVDTNGIITTVAGNGVITTVAGNGYGSFSGDGSAATNAGFFQPFGVSVDGGGNLFIADAGNNRIRKVDSNGTITTVAGVGTNIFSGDGGAATNAAINYPWKVVPDNLGNLFIADTGNNRIRKVDTNGIITTAAGNGSFHTSGDGGAATSAGFNANGVALDAEGNLFIADSNNNRIRKVARPSYYLSSLYLPTLILSSVSTNNMGNYSVVITDSDGSVTSSVVTLTVLISPPSITTPTLLANGQFQFSFDTVTNINYAVQYSTNLTQWVPLETLGGIGEPLTVTNPSTTGSQQRFYRIVLSPQ